MKTLQVFESSVLDEFEEDLLELKEISDDTYFRWYPRAKYFDPDLVDNINAKLILDGMDINESDPYFYVLIHFGW